MALRHFMCASFLTAAALSPQLAKANNTVLTESVNYYGGSPACSGPDICNSVANSAGFMSGMTTPSGTPWSAGPAFTNNTVWDSDFVDPERVGGGNDTGNFDRTSAAISYFTGHGTADAGFSSQTCSSSSQCNSPDPGQSLPGVCRNQYGATGVCAYHTPRYLITHSSSSSFGDWIDYSSGAVAFGESSNSGSWAGAGTNGNVNMAILDLSNGVMPQLFWEGLGGAFAGVRIIGTLMPTVGDTANVAGRGAAFAARWQANPNGSVGAAWAETMNSLPSSLGLACAQGGGTGGRGFNGCGCNVTMTVDSSTANAYWDYNESWIWLTDETQDAWGNSNYVYGWVCNYTDPWFF